MNIIDFEDFVSYVVEEDTSKMITINGSIMMRIRRELLSAGIICDFSPGAINTFAFHYPHSVTVSHFEIKVCSDSHFSKRFLTIRSENEEIKKKVLAIWKKEQEGEKNAF